MNIQDMIRGVVIEGKGIDTNVAPKHVQEPSENVPVTVTSEKYVSYHYGYELRIVVFSNGVVWSKAEKQSVTKASNCNAVKGGVWKQYDAYFFRYVSVEKWLENIHAEPSNFRGMPKGVK